MSKLRKVVLLCKKKGDLNRQPRERIGRRSRNPRGFRGKPIPSSSCCVIVRDEHGGIAFIYSPFKIGVKKVVVREENSISDSSNRFAEAAVAIAGRKFSEEEKIALEKQTLERHIEHRQKLLKEVDTVIQVATRLKISPPEVLNQVSRESLLAIREDGEYKFPRWQFDEITSSGVIDGLPEVIKALNMSSYSKLNWFTRSNPYLCKAIPYEALKAGRKESVIAEAFAAGWGK